MRQLDINSINVYYSGFYEWHTMSVQAHSVLAMLQIFWRYDIVVFFYSQIKNQLFTSPLLQSDIRSGKSDKVYYRLHPSSQVLQSLVYYHALCLQNEIFKRDFEAE